MGTSIGGLQYQEVGEFGQSWFTFVLYPELCGINYIFTSQEVDKKIGVMYCYCLIHIQMQLYEHASCVCVDRIYIYLNF